ncbi:hypothetical protein LJC33_04340 [Eubacteriales bacterium OttesenSCG-928-N13]|nr:hypothetical protein [Eubacteriales bacterium OttesenSCG-928-N13]
MKPIDFDERYADFAEKWVRENMKKYKSIEQMEAHLPKVYIRFLNQSADWLEGKTPSEYFQQFTSPEQLIELLQDYQEQQVDVPDLLLERLVELGNPSVEPLLMLASDESMPEALRVTALNLLIELGSDAPMPLCLELVDSRGEYDDLADVAAELLAAIGHAAVAPMLDRLADAGDDALATYLDLLCNFPGDSRIYEYTMRQFQRDADRRALFASYLGKIGDERAVEPLIRALQLSDLNYLDYIEIRNAIELLGSDANLPERSFEGDPYYESMRQMN